MDTSKVWLIGEPDSGKSTIKDIFMKSSTISNTFARSVGFMAGTRAERYSILKTKDLNAEIHDGMGFHSFKKGMFVVRECIIESKHCTSYLFLIIKLDRPSLHSLLLWKVLIDMGIAFNVLFTHIYTKTEALIQLSASLGDIGMTRECSKMWETTKPKQAVEFACLLNSILNKNIKERFQHNYVIYVGDDVQEMDQNILPLLTESRCLTHTIKRFEETMIPILYATPEIFYQNMSFDVPENPITSKWSSLFYIDYSFIKGINGEISIIIEKQGEYEDKPQFTQSNSLGSRVSSGFGFFKK